MNKKLFLSKLFFFVDSPNRKIEPHKTPSVQAPRLLRPALPNIMNENRIENREENLMQFEYMWQHCSHIRARIIIHLKFLLCQARSAVLLNMVACSQAQEWSNDSHSSIDCFLQVTLSVFGLRCSRLR